jgi:hypothetical protein
VLAPVTVMLLTVMAEAPLLVTVMGFEAGTFTVSFPKARLVGLNAIGAATPVPVNGMFCVPTPSVRVTEAERPPVPVGLKVTVIVQLPEAGMLDPQLLVCWKLTVFEPVTVMLVTVMAVVWLFFTVTGFETGTFTVS